MYLHRIHPQGLLHFLRPVAKFPIFHTSRRIPQVSPAAVRLGITSFAIRKAVFHSDRQRFQPNQGPDQPTPRGTQSYAPGSQKPKNDATASTAPYHITGPTLQFDPKKMKTAAQHPATDVKHYITGFDQMGIEQKLSHIRAFRNIVIMDSQRADRHWPVKARDALMKDLGGQRWDPPVRGAGYEPDALRQSRVIPLAPATPVCLVVELCGALCPKFQAPLCLCGLQNPLLR